MPPSTAKQIPPDSAQDYLLKLDKQYKTAKNAYDSAKAKADGLEKEYLRKLAWSTLLQGYWDAVRKTDRLAQDILSGLDKTIEQSNAIASSAEWSFQAFQNMVSETVALAECVEDFKDYLADLHQQFPKLATGDPLITHFAKLEAAVAEAFTCVTDALLALLHILKNSEVLHEQLGATGLYQMLTEIRNAFKTGTPKSYYLSPKNYYDGTCSAPVVPAFPLEANQAVDNLYNRYWNTLKGELKTTEEDLYKTDGLWEQMGDAIEARGNAKACLDSLEAALKAALESNACKTK